MGVVVRFVFYGCEDMNLDECLALPEPTKSQYNTVHRAVASLESKGQVRTSSCRFITNRPGTKTVMIVQLADDRLAETVIAPGSRTVIDGL